MSVLAADFGGTRIKIGRVEDGRVCSLRVCDTRAGQSLESRLPELQGVFEEMAATAGSRPEAMVWALPSIVAPDHRTMTRAFGKFDDARDLDLEGWVREHFDVPLLLENDARAAAIGEWTHGAGKGCADMAMVTLGTGIGTAVISLGRPLQGRTGLAGNLGGHNIIFADGRLCSCGLRGCAEAHAATWALPAIARESSLFATSSLSESSLIEYRAVFEHARRGDELATELKENALQVWTVVLVNLIHQFDPERLVIGGGIMAGVEEIHPLLESSLRRMLPSSKDIALCAGILGDAAALLGCESLWKQHLVKISQE